MAISYVDCPNRQVIEKVAHAEGTHGSTVNRSPRRRSPRMCSTPGAIEPGGGSGVPAPAAAACVRRSRVDVAGEHVRFGPVPRGVGQRARVIDRVEHVEQLRRFIAIAELGDGHHDPHRRVRVLAAVLANAGRIALDVAGLLRRAIERRRRAAAAVCESRGRPARARTASIARSANRHRHGAGEHRPRLRDRVDRGTRRSAPIRAAGHRRSSRGGTTRHPRHVRACVESWRASRDSGRPASARLALADRNEVAAARV